MTTVAGEELAYAVRVTNTDMVAFVVVIQSELILVTRGGWLRNHFIIGGWSFDNKRSR